MTVTFELRSHDNDCCAASVFEPARTDTPGRRRRRNWAVTARSISISLRVWSQIPSLSLSACARSPIALWENMRGVAAVMGARPASETR